MKKIIETLVRDGTLTWAQRHQRRDDVRKAAAEELPRLYRLKLQEELDEYIDADGDDSGPALEELADLIEVAYAAACEVHGVTPHDLDVLRASKRILRGGFNERYVLKRDS